MSKTIEQKTIDSIRMLSIDMVEKAKSGHPGLPMGAAPMGYTLYSRVLKVNPNNPKWFDRDRFVLAAGHGSAMLYSLLHLFGYDVSIDDIKNFRQFNSRTPGHPEYRETPGVDVTSGPLGQGIGHAVGMALAENYLGNKFNKKDEKVIDHYTYALCGDGDMMEGISSEAASFAGHNQLGKLILLYDSNNISLDGDLNQSFSEDVQARFRAYGWHTSLVEDGNDVEAIEKAILEAKKVLNKPSLIEVKTVIGYGSPNKAGTSASHGAPLGEEERELVKKQYGWEYERFEIPKEVDEEIVKYQDKGKRNEEEWTMLFSKYKEKYPEDGQLLEELITGKRLANFDEKLTEFSSEDGDMATRVASGKVINELASLIPEFIGGSADLGGSNNTFIKDSQAYSPTNLDGKNIWFGVREFAMGSILNGMCVHGGLKVFGATFFVFSDYLRSAIRMAALMNLPVTYVFTHDSIAVGEDGPTHEPVEHLASLRAMPNLRVIRPADAKETQAAWKLAIRNTEGPIALVLSRQALPILSNSNKEVDYGVNAGAYTVRKTAKYIPDAILLATGSEVSLALKTAEELMVDGIDVNVVSMPSWENFVALDKDLQNKIIPKAVKARISIEAGSTFGWERFVGDLGETIGIDHFGGSAPAFELFKAYGLESNQIVEKVKKVIAKVKLESEYK